MARGASGSATIQKSTKKSKDVNVPKRNLSSYMIWLQQNRSTIKATNDSVADVAKKAGVLWKKMTADDKKKWEKLAAADKKRYQDEMASYSG